MGHLMWISGMVAAMAVFLGISLDEADQTGTVAAGKQSAYARPEIAKPASFTVHSSGSALATAAFGMSALQPETYDGEMVLDIIDASPLAAIEKSQLYAALRAAEDGRGSLEEALADIRVALAIE